MDRQEANKADRHFFMRFGLAQIPWVIGMYVFLVFIFATLLLVSCLPPFSQHLGPVAADGLKTVLAALLGALSQIGGRRTSGREC